MTPDAVGGALPASEADARTHTHPRPPTEPTASPACDPRSHGADGDLAEALHLQDTAALLLSKGIRLFPIHDGKRPSHVGWQRLAADNLPGLRDLVTNAQDRWAYGGVGAVTGERHAVLDIDGHVGLQAMEDLAYEAGEPLFHDDHLVARTPRGGRHLWYEVPPGEPMPRNATHLLDAPVDFRGRGGLAVVVGPMRSMTGTVTPPLPGWLRRVLDAEGTATLPEGSAPITPADRERVSVYGGMVPLEAARTAALLDYVARATEGKRNALLYWATKRLALAWWSTRGRAPWPELADALTDAAVTAGLGEREARGTVASAKRWADGAVQQYGRRATR